MCLLLTQNHSHFVDQLSHVSLKTSPENQIKWKSVPTCVYKPPNSIIYRFLAFTFRSVTKAFYLYSTENLPKTVYFRIVSPQTQIYNKTQSLGVKLRKHAHVAYLQMLL